MFPRRFALVRHVDYTGVSGVGVVAYGVVFADGHVALRWYSDHPATSLWNSIDDLLAVHGHGDATSVQWIDDVADRLHEALESLQPPEGRRARRNRDRHGEPPSTPQEHPEGHASEYPPPPPPEAQLSHQTTLPHEPSLPVPDESLVPAQRRPGGKHRRRTDGPDGNSARYP